VQRRRRWSRDEKEQIVAAAAEPGNVRKTLVIRSRAGKYSSSTQTTWKRELDFAAHPDCLGTVSLQEIRPALVQAFMDGIADRPGKQGAAMRALQQLEKWAIVRDFLPRPITTGVEIGHSDGGHIPWTDEQVAAAERHCRADLARVVTLAANTGQRGSDLVLMC
jgi:hypothetical protein